MRWFAILLALVVSCGGRTESSSADAEIDAVPISDTSSSDSAIDTVPADTIKPDTGASLTESCKAAGGAFCTAVRWNLCPIGYEPIGSGDGHYGCGTIGGWCCAPAPPSSCSSSGAGNCVKGATCSGCWTNVTDPSLTCEAGRSCCIDNCD